MQTIEYRDVVDKSKWPRGEWDNEPDKLQWQDAETGFPCLIVRGPMGALCGYVGVPEQHSLHGASYAAAYEGDRDIRVHGGLTFADACKPDADERRHICHKPAPGEPDHVWWLGFDCAHAGDFAPAYESLRELGLPTGWGGNIEYRNIEYVKAEIASLAKQLSQI